MTEAPDAILLVVMEDAEFRTEAFDRLTGDGHRVDAVADQRSAERRLSKDTYDLIVLDRAHLAPAEAGPTLLIDAADGDARAALEARVRAALEERP